MGSRGAADGGEDGDELLLLLEVPRFDEEVDRINLGPLLFVDVVPLITLACC